MRVPQSRKPAAGDGGPGKLPSNEVAYVFLAAGTGNPAILRFTKPRKLQLVTSEGLQVRTAERKVRGLRLAMDDAPELLAPGIKNPDAAHR
jgi:hypothetical protein